MDLKVTDEHGKILKTEWGRVYCPHCNRKLAAYRFRGDTIADNLPIYCKYCKAEIIINVRARA